MSSGSLLYPRLPRPAAEARWESIRELSLDELAAAAQTTDDAVVYAATGGSRAHASHMGEIRARVLEVANRYGHPTSASRLTAGRFDAEAAECLFRTMKIAPGEACRDEVWSFVTLVLLPDIARWRFPESGLERFIGGAAHRNTFQRLWWRAYVLRDADAADEFHLLKRLSEDALVGMMERPGISSNITLARMIAREGVSVVDAAPSSVHEDIWRDAYKRIRQRIPVVNLDGLDDQSMRAEVQAVFSAAVQKLRQPS